MSHTDGFMSDRLFTPRFLTMFCYSFTVFVSVFQLLPASPYRILALGGSTAVAGLFHGMLTFSSALSAAFTGPITDRIGHRPVLIGVSLVLAVVTASYAFIESYTVMLWVAFGHGLIWSALLSASGAYMMATIPAGRRAEGLSYWGLSSVLAIGAAPALGFWVYRHGWTALCAELALLNVLMAVIAWYLPDDRAEAAAARVELENLPAPQGRGAINLIRTHVEWRVLFLSVGMALTAFGWGSLTSFSSLFADALGVTPRSLFLSTLAVAILIGRLTIGRTLDRLGHRRVLLRCFLAPPAGLALLAVANGQVTIVAAAIIFGAGFGLTHPAYTAYIMGHVAPRRRGAAFGAMLAAFDTGIGLGSSIMGWLIHAHGFRVAFGTAAMVAACSLPYFLFAERRLGFRE
jgi:MFS family permease